MVEEVINGLVTGDGTKVLNVEEFDKFLACVPKRYRPVFELRNNNYIIPSISISNI